MLCHLERVPILSPALYRTNGIVPGFSLRFGQDRFLVRKCSYSLKYSNCGKRFTCFMVTVHKNRTNNKERLATSCAKTNYLAKMNLGTSSPRHLDPKSFDQISQPVISTPRKPYFKRTNFRCVTRQAKRD